MTKPAFTKKERAAPRLAKYILLTQNLWIVRQVGKLAFLQPSKVVFKGVNTKVV